MLFVNYEVIKPLCKYIVEYLFLFSMIQKVLNLPRNTGVIVEHKVAYIYGSLYTSVAKFK